MAVRRVPAWVHPQAAGRTVSKLTFRPGWRGSGARPIVRVPIQRFTAQVAQVPLTGGQAVGTINGAGAATLKIGPNGFGTTWYPSQCTISTSTGALDNSTCAVYIGSQSQQNLQGGQSYAGGGDVVALSVQSMQPGDLLIAIWQGGNPGDTCAINVTGEQTVLAYQ